MIWSLLAPGPSATAEQADLLRRAGIPLGVISSAYPLAPWADFICATDMRWWQKNPEAKTLPGKKFSPWQISGIEKVRCATVTSSTNSGVLGLECAKRLGATKILLLGFDMHGTHFFGNYTNGLTNTPPKRREVHKAQYATWARSNPTIQVVNCTQGSALKYFPMARLDEFINQTGELGRG